MKTSRRPSILPLFLVAVFVLVTLLPAADPVPRDIAEAVALLETKNGAGKLALEAGATTHRDLAYVEGGHERQKLDLVIPAKGKGPMPLICFIHGGGWRNGKKSLSTAMPLVVRGYAIAGIGYRLTDAASFPAQIHDCKAAIRWLRSQAGKYGYDADRIGVWGTSAGGHLSALLGTSGEVAELEGELGTTGVSSRVQAVCDFYGPADFLLSAVGGRREDPGSPVALLLGGITSEKREVARLASPVTWVTRDDAPFLIFQGGKDRTVPPDQSRALADALKKAGVPVDLVEFPEAEHGGPDFKTAETLARIADFFDRSLKGGKSR